MSLQVVAMFDLSDGDRVFLFWNPVQEIFVLTSSHDSRYEVCRYRDVRRTIYWALGETVETCDRTLTIRNLHREHSELLKDGAPWMEICTPAQCLELLDQEWGSYAANKIFLSFVVD